MKKRDNKIASGFERSILSELRRIEVEGCLVDGKVPEVLAEAFRDENGLLIIRFEDAGLLSDIKVLLDWYKEKYKRMDWGDNGVELRFIKQPSILGNIIMNKFGLELESEAVNYPNAC